MEGGRFEVERRNSPEDSFEKGVEAPEQANLWLAELGVTTETLERIRQYPAHQESSAEYLIYNLLLAKLIEQGAEWDALLKQRVRNLIGSMRVIALSNMTQQERDMIQDYAEQGLFSSAETEINPNTIADVKSLWSTFGFRKPSTQGLPQAAADTIRGFFPPQTPKQ